MPKTIDKSRIAAASATKAPALPQTQVSQPEGQVSKSNGRVPAISLEAMKTSELIYAAKKKNAELKDAYNLVISRAKELYPIVQELELRFDKQPGQRNDLDDTNFPAMGWYEYLKSLDINPNTYRGWKKRVEDKLQLLIDVSEKQVAGDSAPVTARVVIEATGDDTESQVKRSEATQALLEQERQALEAEAEVAEAESVESEVLTPTSSAAPLPPFPGATFTRDEANADAEMRQTTELVGKRVWLARSADAFILVLAYDKETAQAIANLNDIVPVSCINVDFAETAVIMKGVIDEGRGFRLSMNGPSEVEKTDAKKPAESETTMEELVEAA